MKIYVLGDSISLHYGPYLKTYLKGIMEYSRKEGEEEALLNLDNPHGANGGDSSMIREFLTKKADTGGIDADLLLLNCGLHDIKTDIKTGERQILPDQYKENLQAIVKITVDMGINTIWVRTTPCDDAVHNNDESGFYRYAADCNEYNKIADEVMTNAGIPSIDLYTFTCNLGTELYCDHIHFIEPIREKQAAFIAGWLDAKIIA